MSNEPSPLIASFFSISQSESFCASTDTIRAYTIRMIFSMALSSLTISSSACSQRHSAHCPSTLSRQSSASSFGTCLSSIAFIFSQGDNSLPRAFIFRKIWSNVSPWPSIPCNRNVIRLKSASSRLRCPIVSCRVSSIRNIPATLGSPFQIGRNHPASSISSDGFLSALHGCSKRPFTNNCGIRLDSYVKCHSVAHFPHSQASNNRVDSRCCPSRGNKL